MDPGKTLYHSKNFNHSSLTSGLVLSNMYFLSIFVMIIMRDMRIVSF